MTSSTQYAQAYQQAVSAYINGSYEEAATITDRLVKSYSSDPNLHLLRGHVYCCLQRYGVACEQYQTVLELTSDPELVECANNSLRDINQLGSLPEAGTPQTSSSSFSEMYSIDTSEELTSPMQDSATEDLEAEKNFDFNSFDIDRLDPRDELNQSKSDPVFIDPFTSESTTSPDVEESTRSSDALSSSKPVIEETLFETDTSSSHSGLSNQSEANAPKLEVSDTTPLKGESEPGSSLGSDSDRTNIPSLQTKEDTQTPVDFFDDLGELPDFDLTGNLTNQSDYEQGFAPDVETSTPQLDPEQTDLFVQNRGELLEIAEHQLNTGDSRRAPTPAEGQQVESQPKIRQGVFALLENTSLKTRQLLAASATGIISALAVIAVSQFSPKTTVQQGSTALSRLAESSLVAVVAGIAGGATTFALGQMTARRLNRATDDLQTQFNAVIQGDFSAQATVHSQDELGQLATSFNQMIYVMDKMTGEAKQKADEQEKAKEDLQRQVIRLLDDVEGAARGDLTVKAEVTADVLGAVADSFNLTIDNLQKIVRQVKIAAHQVSTGAAESEVFARSLSSDALRQAEELAVTLNSVQMMTHSIQRVAESAREAEEVARSASTTANKGGDAVEQTVTGISKIRGTVAETTRKVKRLAESSQEISKIVALISQIASRTNLLALNASIEAARAGEAGRGFAIVADEVRQLADRAAKASKEIEQIVQQIQGETSLVMTAMEEGTQQVIEGTRLAEQAKRSLEDIIQVSERIDSLVRSITANTVEQTETSRAVTEVMEAVESTAQETSQEAQQVSGSLQDLAGVAQDLQASVERFKVEAPEAN
jgi:twitching motility protein PilJ